MGVHFVPKGFQNMLPYFMVKDAAGLMQFAERGLGATIIDRVEQGGAVVHGEFRIGECVAMVSEAHGEWQPMPGQVYLYVPNVDTTYKAALEAGATSVMELRDEFYGDRCCGVKDPCGNIWWMATHKEDVPPEEMEKRMAKLGK